MKVYRQWVPCERNSSYNFILIFLKLCTCFLHGLEMCMWFGYNPWINFCHFFHFVNFVIFWPQIVWKCTDSGYLVSAASYTISYLSSCNFAHLLSMVWRCACGLDLILQLIFVTFHFVNFVIFRRCDNFTEVQPIFRFLKEFTPIANVRFLPPWKRLVCDISVFLCCDTVSVAYLNLVSMLCTWCFHDF